MTLTGSLTPPPSSVRVCAPPPPPLRLITVLLVPQRTKAEIMDLKATAKTEVGVWALDDDEGCGGSGARGGRGQALNRI